MRTNIMNASKRKKERKNVFQSIAYIPTHTVMDVLSDKFFSLISLIELLICLRLTAKFFNCSRKKMNLSLSAWLSEKEKEAIISHIMSHKSLPYQDRKEKKRHFSITWLIYFGLIFHLVYSVGICHSFLMDFQRCGENKHFYC